MGTLIVIFCAVTLVLWFWFVISGEIENNRRNDRIKAKQGHREDRWLATRDDRGADMGGM